MSAVRESGMPAGHIHQLRQQQTCDDGKQSRVSGVLRDAVQNKRVRHEKQTSEGNASHTATLLSNTAGFKSEMELQRSALCPNWSLSLILNVECSQGNTHTHPHMFEKASNVSRTQGRSQVFWGSTVTTHRPHSTQSPLLMLQGVRLFREQF